MLLVLLDIVLPPLVLAAVIEEVDEQLRLNGNPFDVAVAVVADAAVVEIVEDKAGLYIVELLLLLLLIGVMVEELFELDGVER